MDFKTTGLKDEELIERAFNYRYKQFFTKNFQANIRAQEKTLSNYEAEEKRAIDLALKRSEISAIQHQIELNKLEATIQYNIEYMQIFVTKNLDAFFLRVVIGPVLTLQNEIDDVTDETIAAALVKDGILSPIDYDMVIGEFGFPISDIVASFLHLEAYPETMIQDLKQASFEVKAIFAAENLHGMKLALEKVKTTEFPLLTDQEAKRIFSFIESYDGLKPQTIQRLVNKFNEVAIAYNNPLRIEMVNGVPSLKTPAPKTLPVAANEVSANDFEFE